MSGSVDEPTDARHVARNGRTSGDQSETFTEWVERYDHDLRRICQVICIDTAMAQEATQNAWYRAYTRIRTLRDRTRVRAWLVSIAVNEARQLLRRERRRRWTSLNVGAPRSQDPPSAELADLHVALGRLEVEDRELLALRYVLGLTSSEIAEQVGLSPEGVRSRLFRVRQLLQKELLP